MSIIEATGLSKTYGDVTAVDEISLSIDSGEIYGVLGPNGAGKTTTIEMLTGQTHPDTGTVYVLGVDPVTAPVQARSKLGILPEREAPPSFMTPREYFTLIGDIRDMPPDIVESQIEAWSDELSFTEQLDTLHTDLSRGQQQKVMITQAFLHNPAVVVIDEPLVNLDPIMQERVKDVLVEHASDDRTILLSTHDIGVAASICTRVGIVDRGELVTETDVTDADGEDELLAVFRDATGMETTKRT